MVKEKRKNIRRAIRYTARIGLGDGSPLQGCMVSDVSETGARLDVEHPEALPEAFTLVLSGRGGIHRQCRVMWRTEDQIGVRFVKTGAARSQVTRAAAEPADV